jgi:hypothetical protein
MKTYTTVPLILFLCSLTFNLFAQDNVCDAYPLPERNAPIFPYGVSITETYLTQQIEHLVKVETYSDCKKDTLLFKRIGLLNKKIKELKEEIALKKNISPQTDVITTSITALDKSLNDKIKQKKAQENSLLVHFKKICNVQEQPDKSLNSSMLDCLTQLKKSLNHENVFYFDGIEIPEDADNPEQQTISDLNKYKSQLVNSDLNIIENLIGTETLEDSPSSISILKDKIKESNLGADIIVLLDILNTKSAQMKIFKQRLKVLERNSRILIKNIKADKADETTKLANKLSSNLDRTIKLSYKDSWFENNNIEDGINDIEVLLTKLNKLEADKSVINKASVVQRINFLNHANEYFEKYNNTGRFNIGLGAALFNAPDIVKPIDLALDLSEFTTTTLNTQSIQQELETSGGKKLSPIIIATMPWANVTLTLPNYLNSSNYVSDINTWELPVDDTQSQHAFLSRTTIESDYKIDYDINMSLKLFSIFNEFCEKCRDFLSGSFKNGELLFGLGTTDLQLTTVYTTDIREQINSDAGYSNLASVYQLNTKNKIDHSMMYRFIGASFAMADQIRLEAYFKQYQSDYKQGQIKLKDITSWGVNVTYLFF